MIASLKRRILAILLAGCISQGSNASDVVVSSKIIKEVEKNLRKENLGSFDLEDCVRTYTVQEEPSGKVGRGVIVRPGGGVGFPSDVKVTRLDPKRLKPGYYVVRPDQMPAIPTSYYADDFGLTVIFFSLKDGSIIRR